MVGFRLSLMLLFAVAAQAVPLHRAEIDPDFRAPASGRVKVAFFDADWTLRTSRAGATTAVNEDDIVILPYVVERLRALVKAGYTIAVVSNQGWVPEALSYEMVERAFANMVATIDAAGARISYFDFAIGKSGREKPSDVMGLDFARALAARGVSIDWDHSFMVGDAAYEGPPVKRAPILYPAPGQRALLLSNSDRKFAESLRIRFFEARKFFGWAKYGVDTFVTGAEVDEFWRTRRCSTGMAAL